MKVCFNLSFVTSLEICTPSFLSDVISDRKVSVYNVYSPAYLFSNHILAHLFGFLSVPTTYRVGSLQDIALALPSGWNTFCRFLLTPRCSTCISVPFPYVNIRGFPDCSSQRSTLALQLSCLFLLKFLHDSYHFQTLSVCSLPPRMLDP